MTAIPQTSQDDSERRVAPRTRTLKRARILFNNRYSTFDCVVRNISATGALLTMDPSVPLPKTFEVRIGEDEAIRPAKLVYRREMFAGIHFLDLPEEEDAPPLAGTEEAECEAGLVPNLRIVPRLLPASISTRLPWA